MPIIPPYTFFGNIIIPLDMASGVGYVNSTAKANAIGVIGIVAKPITATFIPKRIAFPVGSEKIDRAVLIIPKRAINIIINLYRGFLSR